MSSSSEPSAVAPAAPDPGPHWKLRYWSIFIGQAVSLIGSAMTQFVLLWWITDTTGSVAMLATAGILALLPFALLRDRKSVVWGNSFYIGGGPLN